MGAFLSGAGRRNWNLSEGVLTPDTDVNQVAVPSGIAALPGLVSEDFQTTGLVWVAGPALNITVAGINVGSWTSGGLALTRTSGNTTFSVTAVTPTFKAILLLNGHSSEVNPAILTSQSGHFIAGTQNSTGNNFSGISGRNSGSNLVAGFSFVNVGSHANNEGSIAVVTRPSGGSLTRIWNFESDGDFIPVGTRDIGASGSFVQGAFLNVIRIGTALNTATDGNLTAAFTANMVASTGGPTAAAQNGWALLEDSGGNQIWIPVWK